MRLCKKNFYIIEQSNGVIWNITYDKNIGIIYRYLQGNTWNGYNVVANQGTEKFSAALLSNDKICVLYEDIKGTINLTIYNGSEWIESEIIKNERKENFCVHFKVVGVKNKVYVVYSILNIETGISTIFHQIIDEKDNLSNPKVIDIVKFDYKNPFTIYYDKNKGIYIMYQRKVDKHEIGYKIFNEEKKVWSNFFTINSSNYPYKEYSIISDKNELQFIYIKDEKDMNILVYGHGSYENFKFNKVAQNSIIDSCLIFVLYGQIWCCWILEDKLYSCFFMDYEENFSYPPYCEFLNYKELRKSNYIYNDTKNIKPLIFNEVYIASEKNIKYLIISDLYPYINAKHDEGKDSSCIVYFMNKIYEKKMLYERRLNKSEKISTQLKSMLQEEKIKSLSYYKKIQDIEEQYDKFKEGKELINENINFFQESLIDREGKLNELENINIEKENENIRLRQEVEILNKQIENLKLQLQLKEQINLSNSKPNSSLIKRIFNNK